MEAPKKKIKIQFKKTNTPAPETSSQSSQSQGYFSQTGLSQSDPSQSTPPSDAPFRKPTLKLNTKNSVSSASAPDIKPKKSKAGRAPKPSSKLIESRKRPRDNDTASEEEGATIKVQPPKKKLTIAIKPGGPKTPLSATSGATPVVLKPKFKGKPPKRNPGEGYDSEASDKEDDPAIEEEFILRMVPGEDCEYIRKAIHDKKIGAPKLSGGADVQMKFYHEHGRRAAVIVQGRIYAATLVDLPCIVEGMKSWDKRGWWKSADICQMLWVFQQVSSELEAKTVPLPSIIDPETYQYPHGLTAPMHNVRKRRFRKRITKDEIEKVENEVERLMQADKASIRSRYIIHDPDRDSRRESEPYSRDGSATPFRHSTQQQYSENEGEENDEEDDAEGEDDDGFYTNNQVTTQAGHNYDDVPDADDLEADLEAAMEANYEEEAEAEAATPFSTIDATPSGAIPSGDSGDDSLEDSSDEGSEIDEEERARLKAIQGIREDIADMEKELLSQNAKLVATTNGILVKRIEDQMRKLKSEIQLKKSSIGEGEETE
ncbi:transcription initiation factor tfiid 55 kd subunit [Diplocarpon rosae]|nr:transcription initiation factor tfiid 55 kd subunit [Diplocarpon rosae]